MVYYEKIGAIVRAASPEDLKPVLSEKQIEKLTTVGHVILATIATAGLITIAATMPNALGALSLLHKKRYPHRKFTKQQRDRKTTDTFYYLKRSGYIKMKRTKGDFKILLTSLGRKRLKKLNFETLSVPRPPSWDGKWWQIAADIPTKTHKYGADLLRQKFKDMNMFPLQRTLWFYPFDPRSEVEFIANRFNIGRFVTVMEINRLDKDDEKRMLDFFHHQKVLD